MGKGNEDASLELLALIERKLSALLAVSVEQLLRAAPDLAGPRPRSIDRVLADAGLHGVEIAKILGKSPQAVSQALQKEAKPRAS